MVLFKSMIIHKEYIYKCLLTYLTYESNDICFNIECLSFRLCSYEEHQLVAYVKRVDLPSLPQLKVLFMLQVPTLVLVIMKTK